MHAPDAGLLTRAFDSDETTREEGRNAIISGASVETLRFCWDYAKQIGDIDSQEFWLVEVATSRSDAETIAKALADLTEEVLLPQGRIFEALSYLDYIQKAVFGSVEDRIESLRIRLLSEAQKKSEIVPTDGWEDYDISKPLEQGRSQQHYYDRMRAYFSATKVDTMDSLFEQLQVDFLPGIFGYFIGLTSSLKALGVKSETAIRAFRDFQQDFYPDFRPGLPRTSKSSTSTLPQANPEPAVAEARSRDIAGYGLSKST